MIGIYKITNPNGKVYIGQTIDYKKRIIYYYSLNCKNQIHLYNSFNKYGIENHIFEIIEECDVSLLNERERYYQDLYNVVENGLNCKLTTTKDKSGFLSQETKDKISNSLKNCNRVYTSLSEETLLKMKEGRRKNPKFYKEFEEKSKEPKIISKFQKGKTNIYTCKKVINIETNEIYESVKIVSEISGIKYGYLLQQLGGFCKNLTKYKYYDK